MSHNSKRKRDEMEHNHNIRKKRLSTISGGLFSVDNSGAFVSINCVQNSIKTSILTCSFCVFSIARVRSQRNIRRQVTVIIIILPPCHRHCHCLLLHPSLT